MPKPNGGGSQPPLELRFEVCPGGLVEIDAFRAKVVAEDDPDAVADEDERNEAEREREEARAEGAGRRIRGDRPRAHTIAPRKLSKEELLHGALLQDEEYTVPKTRAECKGGERPCPFVRCRHHLYLDVNPDTGSIKLNFPHMDVWELKETCSLDVADAGGKTLEGVGEIMNLTHERVRQVEVRGLIKLKTCQGTHLG